MAGINLHAVEVATVTGTTWTEAPYVVSTPNVKLGQAVEVDISDF